MILSVIHTTSYKYVNSISYCHNLAILKPRTFKGQELLAYKLEISPNPTTFKENIDFFGNSVAHFSIEKQLKELMVTAKSKVKRSFKEQDNALISTICIKEYASISFRKNRSVFEASNELMKRIFTDFKFDPSFSTVATPINEVMKAKKGVCQDFAQVAIACLRAVGLPARYVSGYIETLPPPGKEKLVGTDASHAWFSVYIPDFGWVDFDPTNDQIPKNQHITTAFGRDYYDVPPLKGVIYGSGKNTMKVSVDIRPFKEELV